MNTSSEENKKKLYKASTDVILNLPPHLVQQILEALPLRDGARTSILSRDWRYKWSSLPQITLDLVFNESLRKRVITTIDFPRVYTDAVNKILLRHRGPIHKFELHVPCHLPKASDIDCWIEFVCLNGVNEFRLDDHRLPKLKAPSCLFSCFSLTHLTLYCGSLSLPPTFQGFPCLISLNLYTNEDDNQKYESLINNCPQLETLELILGEAISRLTIRASKLLRLVLRGEYNYLCLKGTARIKKLVLDVEYEYIKRGGVVELLSSLPNIQKLHLHHLNGCGRQVPSLLAKRLGQLHTLKLATSLTCQYTISFILWLFKSSPQLSRLEITGLECEDCEGKLLQIDGSCSLGPLKHVVLFWLKGLSNELGLVKFLLAHSPGLELMTIKLDMLKMREPEARYNLAKEVMRFPRASPNAEVVLMP